MNLIFNPQILSDTYSTVRVTLNHENLPAVSKVACATLQALPAIRIVGGSLTEMLPATSLLHLGSQAASCYVARNGRLEAHDILELHARFSFLRWDFKTAILCKIGAAIFQGEKQREIEEQERIQEEAEARLRELDLFAQWLNHRPDNWKWQFLCRIASIFNRLQIFSSPYRIPGTHPIFSQNRLQAFFTAFRIDWETLQYFKDKKMTHLEFDQNLTVAFTDFVPVDNIELIQFREKIEILFQRFKLDLAKNHLDQTFANWLWDTSTEVRRRRFFCPFSGKLLLTPTRVLRRHYADAEGLCAMKNEIATFNAIDSSTELPVDLIHQNSLRRDFARLWQRFIDSPPRLISQVPSSAMKLKGVPKKFFDHRFWDWLWMKFPTHRNRFFCLLTNVLILHPVKHDESDRRIELTMLEELQRDHCREANINAPSDPPKWISLASIDRVNRFAEQQKLLNEYELLWEEWHREQVNERQASNAKDFKIVIAEKVAKYALLPILRTLVNEDLFAPVDPRPTTYFHAPTDFFYLNFPWESFRAPNLDLDDRVFLKWLKNRCTPSQKERYFCPLSGELITNPMVGSPFSTKCSYVVAAAVAALNDGRVGDLKPNHELSRELRREHLGHWNAFVDWTRENKFR